MLITLKYIDATRKILVKVWLKLPNKNRGQNFVGSFNYWSCEKFSQNEKIVESTLKLAAIKPKQKVLL